MVQFRGCGFRGLELRGLGFRASGTLNPKPWYTQPGNDLAPHFGAASVEYRFSRGSKLPNDGLWFRV